MVTKKIERLKDDFSWAKEDDRVLAVLLYGSIVKQEDHPKSDLDVALVVPGASPYYYDCRDVSDKRVSLSDVLMKALRKIDTSSKNIDLHVFEELPLHIQHDIIEHHEIIYTSDRHGLSEYFYNYRKLWDDQKHRNTMDKDELLAGL